MDIMESYQSEYNDFATKFKKSIAELAIASPDKTEAIIKDWRYYA